MANRRIDILIVGGGLTGAILMLALKDKGFSCLLVDSKPLKQTSVENFDARTLALSPATIHILRTLGIWSLLEPYATPIDSIHVSEQGSFGSARLTPETTMPLGYVVEMQQIIQVVYQLLKKEDLLAPAELIGLNKEKAEVSLKTPEGELVVAAKLIVAADGTHSRVRQLSALPVQVKDYQQHAIVANIGLARSHHNQAYERFTSLGPLALLPMTHQRVALIWALAPQKAQELFRAEEAVFLKELQKAFGYRLGRFVRAGRPVIFPLRQQIMLSKTAWPLVFVGNAAHTLHPIAGQGLNLGLRGVSCLAEAILHYGLNENMLKQYQVMRELDEKIISYGTNGLIEIFSNPFPGLCFARNLGLLAVDNLKLLKNQFVHYARGFGGYVPDLVCEIPLERKS